MIDARFADASYYLALLNADDDAHEAAVEATIDLRGPIVTTAWVLAELGGRLAAPANRQAFVDLLQDLRQDPDVTIVPPDEHFFSAGVELYCNRPDKEWSLVDCISFCVMQERGLTEAFTADHHFEQAGFAALLRK